MSKARVVYDDAVAEFVKAKAGKDQVAYAKAKAKLHKARAALRASRPRVEGVVVTPETLKAGVVLDAPG